MPENATVTAPERVYPMKAPADDPRFNMGLLIDVIKVLTERGYPKVEHGQDLVELQQALFNFLYAAPTCEDCGGTIYRSQASASGWRHRDILNVLTGDHDARAAS